MGSSAYENQQSIQQHLQDHLRISSILGVILRVTAIRMKAAKKISPVAAATMYAIRLFSAVSSWATRL